MPVITETSRQTGVSVVDDQVVGMLVHAAMKEIPDTVRFYMENQVAPIEPSADVWAQLNGWEYDPSPGSLPGADIRPIAIVVMIHSDGVVNGQETNDNMHTGAVATITAALLGRGFVATNQTDPPDNEPEGEHTLEITGCRRQSLDDTSFRPAGVTQLTFTGNVVRTMGDGMLAIPTS